MEAGKELVYFPAETSRSLVVERNSIQDRSDLFRDVASFVYIGCGFPKDDLGMRIPSGGDFLSKGVEAGTKGFKVAYRVDANRKGILDADNGGT
jgi:hypothetical protein